ncbi:MAG: homogentisate 1,2-dioxygenase, partial [Gemmatimonadota bacterium]
DVPWAPVEEAIAEHEVLGDEARAVARAAWLGRRPSLHTRREDIGGADPASVTGAPLAEAERVVLAVHSRGSNADAMLQRVCEMAGHAARLTVVAPQQPDGEGPAALDAALGWIRDGAPGAPVTLIAARDGWMPPEELRARELEVQTLVVSANPSARERVEARELLTGRPVSEGRSGFGNAHASEALPGALPRGQNSPRRPPYGLFAEQLSGTGFVARRHENLRTWLYRIRPSVQHGALSPLDHPRFGAGFVGRAPEPDLAGWSPLKLPEEPTDFVDGLVTLGGAGDPTLRRGYAVHLYATNRSMEHRAFYDADGDLLLLPQLGGLTLLTELGVLELEPGQLAVVPRGLKLSVLLHGEHARGYVAETFGRHFELPERGPIGANGLADERHFVAPSAWYEDRLDPGYRITAKLGGRLYEAVQDRSPYDVVAWHGSYAPYVYDIARFSPVGNTRVDHGDPSVYTVLTAPMDEQGSHTLDLVVFPPRWDPTEGTFRPPYFHRNVTNEINGIIRHPGSDRGPFRAGMVFITPPMTAHGVTARAVDHALSMDDETADRPARGSGASLWFQFETALPMSLTPWAEQTEARIAGWRDIWGVHRARFQSG